MGIRNELRRRTAEVHRVVDLLYNAHDLGERRHYREFLSRQASVVVPLEARLEAGGVGSIVPDWQERRRTLPLVADLAILQGAFQPTIVPGIATRADVVGSLYVLEVTQLGARARLRAVVAGDDLLSCAATRYLAHGRERCLWADFLVNLDKLTFSLGEMERAVAAAAMSFELFARAARNATPQACWNDTREETSQ